MTINVGELLVQGHYGVAIGRFEPANLWLQGTEHASTPCTPDLITKSVSQNLHLQDKTVYTSTHILVMTGLYSSLEYGCGLIELVSIGAEVQF